MATFQKSSILHSLEGTIWYYFKPKLKKGSGVFNGQRYRRKIFYELLVYFDFEAIVETGTFRGVTTNFFLDVFESKVYSVENDIRNYAYSKQRLKNYKDRIHLYYGDSREFLCKLAQSPDTPKQKMFFYLDAHWYDDLPLHDEIELIYKQWADSVIMIDDVEVPNSQYLFDDYGPGKRLSVDYFNKIKSKNMKYYFPSVNADQETGKKRGCVVMAIDPAIQDKLSRMLTIIPYV